MIDWKSHRADFPAADDYTYFNSAGISPMSIRVKNAIDEVSDMFVRQGMLCEEAVFGRVEEIRDSAAGFIGASKEEIAFSRNTTHAILLAANSIRFKEGDNVVMPAIEFPANVYPWMALTERGVELRMVEPEDGKVTAEMLIDICNDRTRVVTASYAQFSTGQRIECSELGRYCREKGILLHIDAIQALGALKIDVKEDMIDLLSCGGHKWMAAAPGIGLFYCRKELIESLGIPNPGWTGVVSPREYLDYRFEYRKDAARYEEGSPNLQGIYAIGAAIDRFLEIGTDKVESRIMELTTMLAEGLEERGLEVTSPFADHERSGILCFVDPERDSEEIYQRLAGSKVVCSLREGAVRLSPHIYNNEKDIERFFTCLEVTK